MEMRSHKAAKIAKMRAVIMIKAAVDALAL